MRSLGRLGFRFEKQLAHKTMETGDHLLTNQLVRRVQKAAGAAGAVHSN